MADSSRCASSCPGRPAKAAPRRRPAFRRPLLEALEDRTLPVRLRGDHHRGQRPRLAARRHQPGQRRHQPRPVRQPEQPERGRDRLRHHRRLRHRRRLQLHTGVATITPLSRLPTITNAVLINGYTQAGASANTSSAPPPSDTDSAAPLQSTATTPCSRSSWTARTPAPHRPVPDGQQHHRAGAGRSIVSPLRHQLTEQGQAIYPGQLPRHRRHRHPALGNSGADVFARPPTIRSAARRLATATSSPERRPVAPSPAYGIILIEELAASPGNFIGTDVTGTQPLGNAGWHPHR